ncbi:hypothetical protein Bccel_3087 [Pseudobacteroides cellulosolvens ATCC 35603 = DSM 2933]|uniref:Uncharacterized protein n=1 Tax=Pseudobacteroides cellulosolvens ATCC 35603 = DSM 2933 TaxID=398512 RepID=A0A0L6JPQ2_9FIRM|nr:hypothetical protein Bccel_3087 [Pseudobacteroides cellulosolvens ATCC 35603 = DSM 2933]
MNAIFTALFNVKSQAVLFIILKKILTKTCVDRRGAGDDCEKARIKSISSIMGIYS